MRYFFSGLLVALTLGFIVYRRMQRRPGDTAGVLGRDLFAGALVFAFVGPALGMAVVALIMAIAAKNVENLMIGLYGLPWAYLFGIVPALLCGLAAAALKPAWPSWAANLRIGAVGGLYAFIFLSMYTARGLTWDELGFPLMMGALPGAVGALLCARLFYGKPAPVAVSETPETPA